MFASCLHEIVAQAGKAIIECEPRLVQLFERSFPAATVVGLTASTQPAWLESHGDAACHIPIGSLPGMLRRDRQSFDNVHIPYLAPDAGQVAGFRAQLDELGPGCKVGIAWRGGLALSRTRSRSIDLQQLAPVLQLPGCHFVSIQYGDHAEEINDASKALGISIHHWPDKLANLDTFATLTAALDVVVTVCSAPVHFAGALGKPAIVLTPHAPEWRYVGNGKCMVWYPSITLLSQYSPGEWSPVIAEAASLLARHIMERNCLLAVTN